MQAASAVVHGAWARVGEIPAEAEEHRVLRSWCHVTQDLEPLRQLQKAAGREWGCKDTATAPVYQERCYQVDGSAGQLPQSPWPFLHARPRLAAAA